MKRTLASFLVTIGLLATVGASLAVTPAWARRRQHDDPVYTAAAGRWLVPSRTKSWISWCRAC